MFNCFFTYIKLFSIGQKLNRCLYLLGYDVMYQHNAETYLEEIENKMLDHQVYL